MESRSEDRSRLIAPRSGRKCLTQVPLRFHAREGLTFNPVRRRYDRSEPEDGATVGLRTLARSDCTARRAASSRSQASV